MEDVDKAVVARITKEGQNFEILVDCEKALSLKSGKDIDMEDVLATTEIFSDIKKGKHAANLNKFFGTEDTFAVARKIIKEGDIQLTTEYKAKVREEKRKRIIDLIHKNAINPDTNLPHPPQRIMNALEEAKVRIDEYKSAEEQVKDIVTKIRPILPLKYELREISVRIPAAFAGKSLGIIKQYGKVLKDEWQNDGSLIVILDIPAGLQVELEDKINSITKGGVEITVLNRR